METIANALEAERYSETSSATVIFLCLCRLQSRLESGRSSTPALCRVVCRENLSNGFALGT